MSDSTTHKTTGYTETLDIQYKSETKGIIDKAYTAEYNPILGSIFPFASGKSLYPAFL